MVILQLFSQWCIYYSDPTQIYLDQIYELLWARTKIEPQQSWIQTRTDESALFDSLKMSYFIVYL